jgi:hypothetical protein
MAKIVNGNTRKRILIRDLNQERIYAYGYDNSYPQQVFDLINSSGTAKASTNLFIKYVMGGGISDPQLYKKVVNSSGVTLDKLMRFCISDYCYYHGFAVHVAYNALGEITGYNHIPFEFTRLAWDGRIAVYDNWDKRKLKDKAKYVINDIKFYNVFNPYNAISEINNAEGDTIEAKIQDYSGQVFWYSFDGRETYPLAPLDSVLEDIQTDAEVKIGKLKNVKTNFLAAQMVKYKGKFETDQARAEFLESLEQFQGNENTGNVMLVEVEDSEADFSIEPFTIQDFDKKWESTERTVKENIIQALGQPQVLLSMTTAGKLGTANEIQDAKDFYNEITASDRLIIEEEFTRLLQTPITIIELDAEVEVISEDGTTAEPVVTENVAATALNGAQISSLNEIIANITGRIYPADTGRAIIAASFPSLTQQQVDQIINPLNL